MEKAVYNPKNGARRIFWACWLASVAKSRILDSIRDCLKNMVVIHFDYIIKKSSSDLARCFLPCS